MRASGPGWCKFGPERRNQQHGKGSNRLDELAKYGVKSGMGPFIDETKYQKTPA